MLLNGTAITQQTMVYTEPNTAWQIMNNGDLNGDGKSNLLWWNSSTRHVHEMRTNGLGVAFGGQQIYQDSTSLSQSSRRVIATLNPVSNASKKGKADLIW
jgi:hypothetical protein